MKNTHAIQGVEKRRQLRERLRQLPKTDGLCFGIGHLADKGLFKAQRSWVDVEDSKIRLFKYEDLTGGDQFREMRSLFNHCAIPIPDMALHDLLRRHGFENTENRRKGQEDRSSHRRKGVAGDWVNHFDSEVRDEFKRTVGNLPQELGYASTDQVLSTT